MGRAFTGICVGATLTAMTMVDGQAEPLLQYACDIDGFGSPIYVTVFDMAGRARIGTEPGMGGRAEAQYDPVTGSWWLIERSADGLPRTITTILRDGSVWHSRHMIDVLGTFIASQLSGQCVMLRE